MCRAAEALLLGLSAVIVPNAAIAQADRLQQSQADAAQRMILLAVEQGIGALPPASGQSFIYSYDAGRDTFVRTQQPGPIVLRSPETLGAGRTDLRAAVSYFHLDESFAPIDYQVREAGEPVPQFTRFGLDASADVTLLTFAAVHGITDWLDGRVSLPLVIVDARARARYLVRRQDVPPTPPSEAGVVLVAEPTTIDAALCRGSQDTGCTLAYREDSFTALGLESFDEGANAGLGRSGVGVKAEAFKAKGVQLAVDLDLLLPSPNQAELSGSDSFAMVPRVIAGFVFLEWLRLYADAGYDYDLKVEELRRFSWDAGFSIPHRVAVVDVGFSGSVYQQAVRWTPTVAPIPDVSDPSIIFGDFVKLPKQDNELGTTYVNALVGLKVKIWRTLQLGGAVVVPVDASEFRPDALGTLAIEAAF